MGKWVSDYIHDVSKYLSIIAAYRDKNIELHLQAQQELLPLLFAFNHQNYSRYLTYHHVELQALKHKHFSAYEQLKTYGMGASLTGRKFSTFPGDLVTEVTVNREVKIRSGLMRGGYSTSIETVDDFILNTHALAKLRRALKYRINVKTSSNHKEFAHGQKKMHERYFQQLLKSIPTGPSHGPARNIMSGVEISSKIIDGLLTAKETGEKLHLEFVKN